MENFLKNIARGIIKGVIYSYCKIIYRFKIYGLENIPKEGAVLFCGNHRNMVDPQIIIVSATRRIRFMAKEELGKNKFLSILGNLFKVIYVKRDEKDITALKEAIKALKNQECLGIFPEGTRNGFEKNKGQIKNGASYLAIKTGATIIPIGIIGKGKPFTKNAIIYGKPIDCSQYKEKRLNKEEEKQAEQEKSELLKSEILRLSSMSIKEAKNLPKLNSANS